MRTLTLLSIFLIGTTLSYGQSDTIFYSFPNEAIKIIEKHLDSTIYKSDEKYLIFIRVQEFNKTVDLDLYIKHFPLFEDNERVEKLVKSTNRYCILRNGNIIPIVLMLDWIYAIEILYEGNKRYTTISGDIYIEIDKYSNEILDTY